MKSAILTDVTRCTGCEACVIACKAINDLPVEAVTPALSATTWTSVEHHHGVNVRRHCMHCEHPACVSACPVNALIKTEQGAVIYDPDRCMGCRYCQTACPFDIPKYDWSSPSPQIRKCVLCFDKALQLGKEPACTAVCPNKATVFGKRDALIQQACATIHEFPEKYTNQIYGLTEAGGTSVLYLSAVPFVELGFPAQVRHAPYSDLTWKVISQIPNVCTAGGVFLLCSWWIIRRRMKLLEEKQNENHS